MIDWITVVVPLHHRRFVGGNVTTQRTPEGFTVWCSVAPKMIMGSFDDSVAVRSVRGSDGTGDCSHIYISGNLVKFFQGHNVFGTDDLRGLLMDFLLHLPNVLDLDVCESPIAHVDEALLKRVDINYSFRCESSEQVENWIAAVERCATLRYRGRGVMSSGTLYYGKNSRRWSLKFYNKKREVIDNRSKHRNVNKSILEYADGLLRCEVVLRGMELNSRGLRTVKDFEDLEDNGVCELFERYLRNFDIGVLDMKTLDYKTELSGVEQAAYTLWLQGFDLREVYPRATFYRHKKSILDKLNINVAIPCDGGFKKLTYPTIEFVKAKFEPTPSWAIGTDFYYDPKFSRRNSSFAENDSNWYKYKKVLVKV